MYQIFILNLVNCVCMGKNRKRRVTLPVLAALNITESQLSWCNENFFIKRWGGFFVFHMLILNLRFVHWELFCKFTNWIKGCMFCGLVGRSGRGDLKGNIVSFQLMGMLLRSGLPLSRPVFVCFPPHNRVISHSKWWSGTNTSFSLLKKAVYFQTTDFLLWKIKLICTSVLG